ncbi:hypothetical protein Nepgr_007734 [Nepenthes gracilis]|uniref:Uncharacterized protein n=1 Tax=Nepenthes gracilis TaxID=150966 RepID=A0AAD3XIL6_NEPGR|nr:hypothetical protein Nepgr_007734 [Nepenthes gracilis]
MLWPWNNNVVGQQIPVDFDGENGYWRQQPVENEQPTRENKDVEQRPVEHEHPTIQANMMNNHHFLKEDPMDDRL